MTGEKRVGKRTSRPWRRLAPSSHTMAKQSAAVLALGLGLAAGTPAEAKIHYFPVDQTLVDSLKLFLYYEGRDNLGAEHYISHYNYSYAMVGQYLGAVYSLVQVNNSQYAYALLLDRGTPIKGEGNQFTLGILAGNVNGSLLGYWAGKTGYVGLQFGDYWNIYYAWAKFSVPADVSSLTFWGYAYEDVAGKPILAGDTGVPIPSSLLLLSSGAAGLLAYRRRRRAG